MNRSAVLAAFDAQVRQRPPLAGPACVEHDEHVVRVVSDGWAGVTWSDLTASTAGAVIEDQILRFAALSTEDWEWKLYSYDQPLDLAARLIDAGFVAGAPESLLVAEIADLECEVARPPGVDLQMVQDRRGADTLAALHDEVFGGDHSAVANRLLAGLSEHPPFAVAVVAYAGDRPVSAGRLELPQGTDFASLWGGGTLPDWRRRGLFRALVAYRAAIAANSGFRYLQVDATAASRPILQRLGFVELATTTPYAHLGDAH